MTLPTVSVVVINFNGRQHLEPCFSSLLKQDYPAALVELILVDNHSQDGSLELMADRFPTVKVIANGDNRGFAPAVNQGAEAATGDYLALINNDAYADPQWLRAMVAALESHRDDDVICVGARMLDWHGQRIDFVGGGVNFYGHGDQFFHQFAADAVAVAEQELLFACGGAMLIDRRIFLEVGGFDEDYFAYFEDVDLGWRLWLYGYRVRFAPEAIVYHRSHGTSSTMYGHQVRTLLERNALMTIVKNYDDEHLHQVLPAALLLLLKRSLLESNQTIDRREFDLRQRQQTSPDPTIPVPKLMLSYLIAAGDLIDDFPRLWAKRQAIQARRARPDAEIVPLFKRPMGTNYLAPSYLLFQETLTEAFDIRAMLNGSRTTRVLILSSDPLYQNLAGPGIRAVEMARYLAQSCFVTLAAPDQADLTIPDVECVAFQRGDHAAVQNLACHAEVLIVQGFALFFYPGLKALHKVLIVDLYDPFHLENLELHTKQTPDEAQKRTAADLAILNEQLRVGDFFICASERQRDLWLGALGSLGRLSPEAYQHDPTFRSLIDVVPFGLHPAPPVHERPVVKGVHPGIAADDTLILWGGGIWDWLDPLTVIRAMAIVREQRPKLKLFFMGYHHPNPTDVPVMAMHDRAVTLAQELGLYHQTVFFNDRWVPYAERANYLLEADIGVSAHLEHVETRFAFRTRLLDYIWAGLPMVVSAGDTLADTVLELGLGHVVPIGDVDAYAAAILALTAQPDIRQTFDPAFAAAREQFVWPQALRPLIEFCRQPRYAADKHRKQTLHEADTATQTERLGNQQRMDELEASVAAKNQHIAYLEGLIQQVQHGRLMRLMRLLDRLRARFS